MKLELNKFLNGWAYPLDDAILALQYLLETARMAELPHSHQTLVGESCNPTTPPMPMEIAGYGFGRPPLTEDEILSAIRRQILRAITSDREFYEMIPGGLFALIKRPNRKPAYRPHLALALRAFRGLHGHRLTATLNRCHRHCRVLAFPSLRIYEGSVVAGCAVTTPGELRRWHGGSACAWWTTSSLTDIPNPRWKPTRESLAAFLLRATEHFENATPKQP